MIRSESLVRLGLTLGLMYLFAIGATWNGLLLPTVQMLSLGLLALLVVVWQLVRWRRGWRWHGTAIDWVQVLWALAFALSILANDDTWRRSFIALWYMGLYAGVWFMLRDLLDNAALTRRALIDAFLMAGLLVVFFGYYQIQSSSFDLLTLDFPRPGSVVGNPNALGSLLIVLMALILGRIQAARSGRGLLWAYLLLVLGLLFATFSRGAWLGAAAVWLVFVALGLRADGESALSGLGRWLRAHAGVVAVALLLTLGAVVLVLASFNQAGRGVGLRADIYEVALEMFSEKPLTGHGLFTFGTGLAQAQSFPPRQPHSHAHQIVLLIAAELGLPGLLALALTAWLLLRAGLRELSRASGRERGLLLGAFAGGVGFMTHQMIDIPAMMPLIALVGLFTIVLATAPAEPRPLQAQWRRRGHPLGMIGLWTLLILTGLWSARLNGIYYEAIREPFGEQGTGDYAAAAARLDAVIAADPELAWYHHQQGFLYGLAAYEGDENALPLAISAFETFTRLEPEHAAGWVNLAALYLQAGQIDPAYEAYDAATRAAPESWQMWANLGMLAEARGAQDLARTAYTQALAIPGTAMHPMWQETALRRSLLELGELRPLDRVLLAYIADEIDSVDQAAELYGAAYANSNSVLVLSLRALVALRVGEMESAQDLLARARRVIRTEQERAWVAFVEAEAAQTPQSRALELLSLDYADADFAVGVNVPHFQFLRLSIPRQFLPQVFYPAADPALLRLLAVENE